MKIDHYMKNLKGSKPIFGYHEYMEGGRGSVDDMPREEFTESLDITGIDELMESWDAPSRISIGGDLATNSSDYIEIGKSIQKIEKAILKDPRPVIDSSWLYRDDLKWIFIRLPKCSKRYYGIFNNFRVVPRV